MRREPLEPGTRADTGATGDRVTTEPPPQTAYDWAGESEWYRLGALDKAENVVRLAPCPVLTLRLEGFEIETV